MPTLLDQLAQAKTETKEWKLAQQATEVNRKLAEAAFSESQLERGKLQAALRWAIDYIADGTSYEEGGTPEHDCGYGGDSGYCAFHEKFFEAVGLLIQAGVTKRKRATQ